MFLFTIEILMYPCWIADLHAFLSSIVNVGSVPIASRFSKCFFLLPLLSIRVFRPSIYVLYSLIFSHVCNNCFICRSLFMWFDLITSWDWCERQLTTSYYGFTYFLNSKPLRRKTMTKAFILVRYDMISSQDKKRKKEAKNKQN